jgi:hypothetical protein
MTPFSSSKEKRKYHTLWHTFGFHSAALAMWDEATSLVPEGSNYFFVTINALHLRKLAVFLICFTETSVHKSLPLVPH